MKVTAVKTIEISLSAEDAEILLTFLRVEAWPNEDRSQTRLNRLYVALVKAVTGEG